MNIIKKLRAAILEEKEKISSGEILMSPEFFGHANKVVGALLQDINRNIRIFPDYDGVAATDGYQTGFNPLNPISGFYKELDNAFDCAMGILFHEAAHIRYLDFDKEREAAEKIEKGILPWTAEGEMTEEEKKGLDILLKLMDDPEKRQIVLSYFHHMANIISDPHDEDKMMGRFGRYVRRCILLARHSMWMSAKPLEMMDTTKPLEVLMSMMLQYARFQKVSTNSDETLKTSTLYNAIKECMPYIDGARLTDDVEEKADNIVRSLMVIAPYIDEALNGQKPSGSGQENKNGSENEKKSDGKGKENKPEKKDGSGNEPVPQSVSQILNSIQEAAKNASQTTAPENRSSSKAVHEKTANPEPSDPSADLGTEKSSAAESIASEMAESRAEEKMDKEMRSSTNMDVNTISEYSEEHIKPDLNQVFSVSNNEKEEYDQIFRKLEPYSKRLQKKVREAFREMKESEIQKHRQIGKSINPKEAYRLDQKYFQNKKNPQDMPTVAVSILVDNSGSMGGSRIEKSREAAILLHDFAKGLGFQVEVAGHKYTRTVDYSIFLNFESVKKSDKYNIMKMYAGGSNRDGSALEISAGRLAKRGEDVKILFIISDGQPAAPGYGGEAAAEHIRKVVKKAERKGVQVIACAIGSDKDNIYRIYKDDFLNVEDLNALPMKMAKILKKRVVA